MINAHWETATRVAFAFLLSLLEDAAKLDEVGTSAKVRCLCEVAVREDMARTEVYEVCAVSKLLSHSNTVVMLASRE